jgi:hypothetical protein
LGATYLELGDCLVYASALLARASEVITIDGYLSHVITGVENPGAAAYKPQHSNVGNIIRPKLAKLLGIEEGEVLFPKAVRKAQLKGKTVTKGSS